VAAAHGFDFKTVWADAHGFEFEFEVKDLKKQVRAAAPLLDIKQRNV